MATITSANAIFTLAIAGLYSTPQQLQGFAADDVSDTDPLQAAETLMGVDGHLSGGFVFVAVEQSIVLQADSPSIDIFDNWWGSQQAIKDLYRANGVLILSGISRKWAMNNGILKTFPPVPNVKKILQPRKFMITWESIQVAPI